MKQTAIECFLCLMAGVFWTTFFFKDKSSNLEKENKQIKDSKLREDIAKEKNNKCSFFLAKENPSTSSNSICICGKEKYLH